MDFLQDDLTHLKGKFSTIEVSFHLSGFVS